MTEQARDLYQRIVAAFLRHQSEFFPPEFPADLLRARLERVVPHLAFHVTPNYAARLTVRPGHLLLEDLLLIGRPSLREVVEIMAWFFDTAKALGLACRGEAFDASHYQRVAVLSEREWLFAVLTGDARDPRDHGEDYRAAAALSSDLVAQSAGALEPHATPFLTTLYLAEEGTGWLDGVGELMLKNKVLVVSCASQTLAETLRATIQRERPEARVGALRPHYSLEVPRLDGFAWYQRRSRSSPRARRLLLEGELLDV